MNRRSFIVILVTSISVSGWARGESDNISVIVMDPLSAKLSCDCVKGYAQRKYERLASHLEKTLGRKVEMVWAESLTKGRSELSGKSPDLVIGKHSIIVSDAKKENWKTVPIASLSGKDGKTTQTGLIVVRKDDPALTAADLSGYRIFFGPADCDEKSAAVMQLLRSLDVKIPDKPETAESCSVAAKKLVALPADEKAAAVISSYAEPLLAGCGTVKKGDLRIVGVSEEVPFITAFINGNLKPADRSAITRALLDVAKSDELLSALESKNGFLEFRELSNVASAKKN